MKSGVDATPLAPRLRFLFDTNVFIALEPWKRGLNLPHNSCGWRTSKATDFSFTLRRETIFSKEWIRVDGPKPWPN